MLLRLVAVGVLRISCWDGVSAEVRRKQSNTRSMGMDFPPSLSATVRTVCDQFCSHIHKQDCTRVGEDSRKP
jgi:hypothetical protein